MSFDTIKTHWRATWRPVINIDDKSIKNRLGPIESRLKIERIDVEYTHRSSTYLYRNTTCSLRHARDPSTAIYNNIFISRANRKHNKYKPYFLYTYIILRQQIIIFFTTQNNVYCLVYELPISSCHNHVSWYLRKSCCESFAKLVHLQKIFTYC